MVWFAEKYLMFSEVISVIRRSFFRSVIPAGVCILAVLAAASDVAAQYQYPYGPSAGGDYSGGYTPGYSGAAPTTYQPGTTVAAPDGSSYYYYVPNGNPQLAQAGTAGAAGTTYAGAPSNTVGTPATMGAGIQGTSGYGGDPYSIPQTSSGGGGGFFGIPISSNGSYISPDSPDRKTPLIWFEDYWIYSGKGEDGLSMNELSAQLVIPLSLMGTLKKPIYIVPGIRANYFSGPQVDWPYEIPASGDPNTLRFAPKGDLPGVVYDIFAAFRWEPQFGENLSLDLLIAPWLGTDFHVVNKDSWRFPGWALGTYHFSPEFALKGGIYYSARDRYDWIPGFGLIWTPHGDDTLQFDVYYPDAGVLWRPDPSMWVRLHGTYGGGRWTMRQSFRNDYLPSSSHQYVAVPSDYDYDLVDVSDLRLLATFGIGEYQTAPRASVTLGWAFHREIRYDRQSDRNMKLKDGFVLGAEARF